MAIIAAYSNMDMDAPRQFSRPLKAVTRVRIP
jgi:hypothetical protein